MSDPKAVGLTRFTYFISVISTKKMIGLLEALIRNEMPDFYFGPDKA